MLCSWHVQYIPGIMPTVLCHADVIKWKHFWRYWPFVRGIHRSPVNSLHKGQWRGALTVSLICAWITGWANNGEAVNWDAIAPIIASLQCCVILWFGSSRIYPYHSESLALGQSPVKPTRRAWVNKSHDSARSVIQIKKSALQTRGSIYGICSMLSGDLSFSTLRPREMATILDTTFSNAFLEYMLLTCD